MTINIDRNIYSDSCISNVVYWFSDRYTLQRSLNGDVETISVEDDSCDSTFQHIFFQKLNDYKLREVIDKDTKDIRTILYAKAFGEFDDLTEEEITE